MVESREIDGKTIFLCGECGFGYKDKETADECEKWCSSQKSCSFEITQQAVYFPEE